MKKTKIIIVCVIILMTVFIIFQNDDLFLTNRSLEFNFFFTAFKTPALPAAIYFIIWLLLGCLIMYFFNLYDRFVANKEIKRLNAVCDQQLEKIKYLENLVETLKPSAAPVAHQPEQPKPVESIPSQQPQQ